MADPTCERLFIGGTIHNPAEPEPRGSIVGSAGLLGSSIRGFTPPAPPVPLWHNIFAGREDVAPEWYRDLVTGPASLAVSGGRILAVVSPGQDGPWRAGTADLVDLRGLHVYPGLSESHGHLAGYGASLEQVDLRPAASFAEVVDRVRAAAAALPAGTWVLGRGWDENRWPGRGLPVHAPLSAAVSHHPVLVKRVDGHAALVNARALALAGINRTTVDPSGGAILRDGSGDPSGVLLDAAMFLVSGLIPKPGPADLERRILAGARRLAAVGLTEIHDAGTTREQLAVLRDLDARGRLPIRVYALLDATDAGLLDDELGRGPSRMPFAMLAVGGIKFFADGSLGARSAWLGSPYADAPGNSGLAVTDSLRLAELTRRAAAAGFQVAVHAIGDAAVRAVLDAFAAELGPASPLRPRIEHAQIVRDQDVGRFAALGALALVQPIHFVADAAWAQERLGPERMTWSYRWRSLAEAGAVLALGSDVPVESPDPLAGLDAAARRPCPAGMPAAVACPHEALPIAAAIAGYTRGAAYARFAEGWRGRIAPGFAADLTVLDRPLDGGEGMRSARIRRTVVAGADAFARDA